jgi:catechol 2,3-dioxygenase-like lactoylglutathione lyase family enzyme
MALSVQSVMHINVNCSDLERSLGFYRDAVGLVPASHTNPVPQDGAGFGMVGRVQWDAHILQDARGFAGPGVDLLEWKQPRPVGQAPRDLQQLGFSRVGLRVPDIGAAHRRVIEFGAPCLSPPVKSHAGAGEPVAQRFLCRDPDGTALEIVESDSVTGPQLSHVNVNCSDLARSIEWYERVLGLETRGGSEPGAIDGTAFGTTDPVEWKGRLLWPPGQRAFAIDLQEWKTPPASGRPAQSANQLGLYRMAFMVADIRAGFDEIRSHGVECPAPVFLDMGPEIPIDGVWALFFPDPDGTCMELIETPKLEESST